jgi:hypothetical protein
MVPGESRANRTLLSSVGAASGVPASVLTAALTLKYSWILRPVTEPISCRRTIRFPTPGHGPAEFVARVGSPPSSSTIGIGRILQE